MMFPLRGVMLKAAKPLLLFSFFFFYFLTQVLAQLPADLSNVKASQISEEQLQQFIRQAESSGMSESQ